LESWSNMEEIIMNWLNSNWQSEDSQLGLRPNLGSFQSHTTIFFKNDILICLTSAHNPK
jgi:hypothetical protein